MAKDKTSNGRDELQALSNAYVLYSNWNTMSPAQKSKAIFSLGIQSYKFSSGVDLAKEWIIQPTAAGGNVGLSLGQAFSLFSQGYNAYSIATNWKQLSNVQRVIGGVPTALNLAKTAKSMGLMGNGTTNAAVKGVNAATLSSAGWSAAPNYGIGAVTAPVGSSIPAGYSTVASGGEGVIAVPTANLGSAGGAIAQQPATSPLGVAAGAATFAAGAYQVYQGWGVGGSKGALNGVLGGSMMAGGLYAMGVSSTAIPALATNPYVLGAVVAVSVLGNTIGTGKSKDQSSRDAALKFYKSRGYVSENNQITLPDGTIVDLGIDGHGNQHTVKDAKLLAKGDEGRAGNNKLNYWDTDYTNDLDYIAGTAGVALAQMTAGGKETAISQLGGKIGNGALANIGYGKEMTQENYITLQNNLRAIYSQFGVKSKADAYQLINQMFAEKRIDESSATSMHQLANLIFDGGSYNQAQNLMSGRWKGVELAVQDGHLPPEETVAIPGTGSAIDPHRIPGKTPNIDPYRIPGTRLPGTTPGMEVAAQNKPTLKPGLNTFDNPPPGVVKLKPATLSSDGKPKIQSAYSMSEEELTNFGLPAALAAQQTPNVMETDREDIVARNRSRYGGGTNLMGQSV